MTREQHLTVDSTRYRSLEPGKPFIVIHVARVAHPVTSCFMKPVEKNLPRTRVDLSETNQLASMPCIVAVGVHRAWFLYVSMSSCFTSAYGEMRYLQQMSWKVMETKSPKRDIHQLITRGPPHPPVGPGVSQLSDLSIASGGGASAVGHQHLWELHGHTDLSNRCGHEGAKKKTYLQL